MMTAWKKFGGALRRFSAAHGGNVAITFSIAAIPIACSVGAAVDYSRANSVKADLQAALDAAALMLSKEASTDTDERLQTNARQYFLANFKRPDYRNIVIKATYTAAKSTVAVDGRVDVPTEIMQIIGYDHITINGSATATWGMTQLRVALALDNTGSMKSAGKINALKTATKSLLSMLKDASDQAGDIQIALIPFANGVNVGVDNVDETWLDWSYYSDSGGAGWSGGGGRDGRRRGRSRDRDSDRDGRNGSSNNWSNGSGSWNSSGTWHGSGGSTCGWSNCWSSNGTWSGSGSGTNKAHWQGCVMDRDQDYDVKNTTPNPSVKATLFPALYNPACPVPMMGLGYDWDALNETVDDMTPTGSTNQTIGLAWAWQALTAGDPFENPAMPAEAQLVIIMLTDGLNTQNRWSTDQSQIDARTQKVCDNIKAKDITLYTIQVNTDGDPTSTLLRNCASDSSKFFLLTKADQILTAFNEIGSNLSRLRIAK